MTTGRRRQTRGSHQARAPPPTQTSTSVHPSSINSLAGSPYNFTHIIPIHDPAHQSNTPSLRHLSSPWTPGSNFTPDQKMEQVVDPTLLSPTPHDAEAASHLPAYPYSEDDDTLFHSQGSVSPNLDSHIFSDSGEMTTPISDLHSAPFRTKTPHRKDIEAKARLKMRMASQRLRHSISPRMDGVTLRGTADVMDRASELLGEYQRKITELQKQLDGRYHPTGTSSTIVHSSGFYNT